MIATNFSDLDTLFKDIQRLHQALTSGSASSLDHDLLVDKVKIYYSLLKNYTPASAPVNPIEKTSPEVAPAIEEMESPEPIQEELIAPVSETKETILPSPIAPIFENTSPPATEMPIAEEIIPIAQEIEKPEPQLTEVKATPQIQSSVKPDGYGRDQILSNQQNTKKKDLKTIIDINTRFGLIQHFFKGNIDFYNHELGWISEANELEEAQKRFSALCVKYNQSPEADLSTMLLEIIKRCYA